MCSCVSAVCCFLKKCVVCCAGVLFAVCWLLFVVCGVLRGVCCFGGLIYCSLFFNFNVFFSIL